MSNGKACPFWLKGDILKTIKNKRILIIDDNKAIHEDFRKVLNFDTSNVSINDLTSKLLQGNKKTQPEAEIKYEIDSAYQGEEGLELVKKSIEQGHPYAMAYVDILMPPGWDGVETIKQIWKVDPDIQVAICTAYSEYSWNEIIKELGISDQLLILKKPFDNIEVRQITCCLVKKWNLNRIVCQKLDELQNTIDHKMNNAREVVNKLIEEMVEFTEKDKTPTKEDPRQNAGK